MILQKALLEQNNKVENDEQLSHVLSENFDNS